MSTAPALAPRIWKDGNTVVMQRCKPENFQASDVQMLADRLKLKPEECVAEKLDDVMHDTAGNSFPAHRITVRKMTDEEHANLKAARSTT